MSTRELSLRHHFLALCLSLALSIVIAQETCPTDGGVCREGEEQYEVVAGNKTYHPSHGIFPDGCKWRLVTTQGTQDHEYQWWDYTENRWTDTQPESCFVTGHPSPGPPGWKFFQDSPRTEVTTQTSHCMYRNLWYNDGKWYALVDGARHVPSWRFSRNQEIITMHVKNATTFANSVNYRVIPGDTILFDFIFFIHPTAIGHWWEMLGPLYSILKTEKAFKRPADQFILLHLQRHHLLEWVRAMISVTLGVKPHDALPPVLVQEETDNAWVQISQSLEGLNKDTWYVFENVLMTRDLYTGGGRTFLSRDDAREFRAKIYQQYGLPPPAPRPNVPRVITFQRKRANRRILNEDELLEMLKGYGELKVVEYNSSSSLYQQLLQMRETGIYISVHTSNLANSPLLQPGSAVVELIHRHWGVNGLDTSFRDQTAMMGDIHHFAWRARKLEECVYLNPRDLIKVGHWNFTYCNTEECVEAHTNVDVIVDVPAVKKLLDDRLPYVFYGYTPDQVSWPWPAV